MNVIRKFNKALLFVAVIFLASACNDDEPPTIDPLGSYIFKSATLLDGNTAVSGAQNLVIKNGLMDPSGTIIDAVLPPGESQFTTVFVGVLLSEPAPCTDPANLAGYQIEFKDGGILAFICPAENLSEDSGTWTASNSTSITLGINVNFSPTPIPIVINDVLISANVLTGTVVSFPMIVDVTLPVDASNLQNISFSIELTKIL